jgi:hypothetical protein
MLRILLGFSLFLMESVPALSASYWTEKECLNAAEIGQQKCIADLHPKTACDGTGVKWSACNTKLQEDVHECIYIKYNKDPCYKLPKN